MALGKLFHSNKSLKEVNMFACCIDDEAACCLVQALCGNTTEIKTKVVILQSHWNKGCHCYGQTASL